MQTGFFSDVKKEKRCVKRETNRRFGKAMMEGKRLGC